MNAGLRHLRQRGFSIIAAIFLIVVVALIATFLSTIGGVHRQSSAYAVVGTRGHFAALAGIEWAVHQVLSNPGAPTCFTDGTTFTLPAAGAGGFRITANCGDQSVTEGTDTYVIFDILITAELGTFGQEDYFRRQMSASVTSSF